MSNTYNGMLERIGSHSADLMAEVRDVLATLGTGLDIDPDSADGFRRWNADQRKRKVAGIGGNDYHPTLWAEDAVSESARQRWEAEQAERQKASADKRKALRAKRNQAMSMVQRAIAAGKATPTEGLDLAAFGTGLIDEPCYFTSGGFISADPEAENGKNARSDTVDIVAAIQRGYVAWAGTPRSGATKFVAPVAAADDSDDSIELTFD